MDKLAKLMQDIGILWDKVPPDVPERYAQHARPCAGRDRDRLYHRPCSAAFSIPSPAPKTTRWPKRILLKILRVIIRIYVEVFRGTPMMLQAVFIFYALPYFHRQRPALR